MVMCWWLCQFAYVLFTELGFINTFHIPVKPFIAYFHALELGYRQNPCKPCSLSVCLCFIRYDNPLGKINSGHSPWAKLIRSASLQLVFDAAISKLLWRLVSRCFYMPICVFSTIRLKWLVQFECVVMWQNVYRQSPDGNREIFKNIMLAVFRILDKLHIFSNISCTCSIFIKMWAQI